MIVDQIDVQRCAVFEPEHNSPVRPHRDRPEPLIVALQPVKTKPDVIDALDGRRRVENGQNTANLLQVLGADAAGIVFGKSRFRPLCRKLSIIGRFVKYCFTKVKALRRGDAVVILLCGGDKRSQDRDIARALELAKEV